MKIVKRTVEKGEENRRERKRTEDRKETVQIRELNRKESKDQEKERVET